MDKQTLEKIVSETKSQREAFKKLKVCRETFVKWIKDFDVDCSKYNHGKTCLSLVGKRFGMLVVESVDLTNKRRKFANCKCDCGQSKKLRCDCIDRYVSCGCHSKNRWNMIGDKNPAFKGYGEIRGLHFNEIKRRAGQRGKEFALTIEFLWELYEKQNRKCLLTGLPIYFGRVWMRNETNASLDRIDNSKGYIESNVRWVIKDINMIRGSYDNEYFIQLCNAVAKQHPREI